MKVGTDSMLLGAWTDAGESKTILDIGTGTGVLSLMMAQKSGAKIDAIEPDQEAFELAVFNVSRSQWRNRIKVIQSRLEDYSSMQQKYDLIISNPPFYKPYLRYGRQAPAEGRRKARSHEGLAPHDLIMHSAKLLSITGKIYLILPVDAMRELIVLAGNEGLWPNKSLLIRSKPESKPIRNIIQLSRVKTDVREEEITIYDKGGKYSREYIKLTEPYHAVSWTAEQKSDFHV